MSEASKPVPCVLSDSLEEEVEGSLEPGALDHPGDAKLEDLDDSLCCEDSQAQLSCDSSSQPKIPPQTQECQQLDDSISCEGMEAMESGIPSVCTAASLASSSAAQTPELPSRKVVCSTAAPSTHQPSSHPAVSSNSSAICSTSPPSAPQQTSSSASNSSCPSQQVPKKKPVFGKKKKLVFIAAPPPPAIPVPESGSSAVAAAGTSEKVEPDCASASKVSAQPSSEKGKKRSRKPVFVVKSMPSKVKPVPSTKEILAKFCAEEEAQKASKSSQSDDIIPTSETSQTDKTGSQADKTDPVNVEADKVDEVSSEAGKAEPPDSAAPVPKAKKPRKVLTPEEREAKKAEQEKKKLEREKKKEEAEKKKIEREMKKKEAEQKKLEREQKKSEKETLKKQKQLEAEKKKAEREQLKIQRELKKVERQQKKARKNVKKSGSSGSVSASSDLSTPADIEEMNGGQSADTSAQGSGNEEAEIRIDEELDIELDVDGFDHDKALTSSSSSSLKAHTSSSSSSLSGSASAEIMKSTCRISREQSAGSMETADGNGSITSSEASKIANNDVVVPVKKPTKRFKPPTTRAAPKPKRSKGTAAATATTKKKIAGSVKKSSSSSKKRKRRETDSSNNEDGSSSDSSASEYEEVVKSPPVLLPLMKRSQPVILTGSVWVQCENAACQKWRKLSGCDDPSELPVNWKCSMNADKEHSSCSVPEEPWNNLEDNQEYVESNLVPGSLVWAKMEGYPWWPAMVEQDPDGDSFYKMGNASCHIPVEYHVVFFDTPVSRGWINSHSIHPFADMEDANAELHLRVAQKHKRALQNGLKQAKTALSIPLKQRLVKYGFFSRYQHLHAVSRKKMHFTTTTESPTLSFHSQSSSDASFDDENRIPKQLQLAGDNAAAGVAAARRLAAYHDKKETETVVIQFEE